MKMRSVFSHPDDVGQSEYRAIYDCINDAVVDMDDDERVAHIVAMLHEFISISSGMLSKLEDHEALFGDET